MHTLDRVVTRYAQRFPGKPALRCGDRSVSWRDLDARVDRVASALRAAGCARGDRVAILLGNCIEYWELYFACARSGCIAVPLNYRLTVSEATAILTHAEPKLLVAEAAFADVARGVTSTLGAGTQLWWRETDLEARCNDAPDWRETSVANESDTFAIFYTSGTTGLPKGAMVSHRNLTANGYNQLIADAAQSDDICLLATPLYHVAAVFIGVTYMMYGCTQVVMPQFTPRAWLEHLQAHRATVSLLVPTMINAVLNEPGFDQHDLSSLRLVFYGGGPMPPAVLDRAIDRLGCSFTQGYGLTETLEATFLVASDHRVGPGDEQRRARLSSAGREAIGAEVRVVDDQDRDVGTGEIGEVLVRSESVIAGYWRQPEETARAIRRGWFYTGDLGYLDAERYLFIVDRKKDMVISGGMNIYTKEVEAVLFAHAAVAEAAVFGLPDTHWGEVVCAAVVVRAGCQVSAEQLIEACRERLASYKKPQKVFFVADLPKNPSGKVLKRELRAALAHG